MIARFEELMGTARLLEVPASESWLAEVPARAFELWAIAPEREDAERALRQVVWRWLGGVNGAPVSMERAREKFAELRESVAQKAGWMPQPDGLKTLQGLAWCLGRDDAWKSRGPFRGDRYDARYRPFYGAGYSAQKAAMKKAGCGGGRA